MDSDPFLIPLLDPFVVLNWGMTIAATACLAITFRRNRYLFLKPSILVLFWYHVFFEWPACVYAAYYERALPNPYAFCLLLHGFVLIGLLVSTNTLHNSAEEVFRR